MTFRRKKKWRAKGLNVAYGELTRPAFSLWIRMHTFTPQHFALGRSKLAKIVGLKIARFNQIMRELEMSGYVEVKPQGVGKPTIFLLRVRCRLVGRNWFVYV